MVLFNVGQFNKLQLLINFYSMIMFELFRMLYNMTAVSNWDTQICEH